MKSLKNYIDRNEMRRTGGYPESAGFHSRGFHKHFEGYSEYIEPIQKESRISSVSTPASTTDSSYPIPGEDR